MENVETSGMVMNVGMCHFSRPKWIQIQKPLLKCSKKKTAGCCKYGRGGDLHFRSFLFNVLGDRPSFPLFCNHPKLRHQKLACSLGPGVVMAAQQQQRGSGNGNGIRRTDRKICPTSKRRKQDAEGLF